jgi:hypothetical protein
LMYLRGEKARRASKRMGASLAEAFEAARNLL